VHKYIFLLVLLFRETGFK